MKKNYLLAVALAIMTMASCSDNDFVGDQRALNVTGEGAIQFVSNTPNITRAGGADAATELGNSFAVYGTKTVSSTESNVFAHNVISNTSNTPYWVWYNTSTANTTTSNTANWEYVGAAGDKTIPGGTFNLSTAQDIKYWDYSASQYIFTAYKNKSGGTVSNITTTGFTFEGNASEFAGLYVADKLTITEKSNPAAHGTANNKIGNAVQFTFRTGAAKVRLGIYETIPGYNVMNVNFKPTSPATFSETTTSAQLSGSFNGGSPSTSQTFTVTYGGGGIAQFATATAATNNYVFGTFDTDGDPYLGENSTSPTWTNASSDYVSVLPNQDHTGNMVLSVDYDLYNTITHETIHVEDAKAVVPQAYMTWNPNYAYTYLFKISDNTNGYTGEGTLPSGLWPISFDAVTVAATDVSEGSITTVSTPSITTYQNGSVSASGITYANANGLLYITVNTDGTLATLNASGTTVKLYTVADGTTEADLLLAPSYTKTEVTSGADVMTVQTSNATVNSVTFSANQYATFTPTASTTYAFYYHTNAVAAVYTAVTNGTTLTDGETYYTSNTGEGKFVSDGSQLANGTNYFSLTTPAVAAMDAYKVIKVVAP